MGVLFNRKPAITEKTLSDQSGKVFIVTGASGGIGLELAQILYAQNARVYIAARSEDKANAAISKIKSSASSSKGELIFLSLNLSDLSTIKASAEEFLSKESKLNVLFNNAGVMIPPQGSTTTQGLELQMGTNCVGPFLFTKLLTPLLKETAKNEPKDSVRVVWVASSAAAGLSHVGGVDIDNMDYKTDQSAWTKYGNSKGGNVLHAAAYARRYKKYGIVSISMDPGNLKTDLWQHMPRWQAPIANLILHEPIYGAYTELYAGFSKELEAEKTPVFVEPWGSVTTQRKDIEASCKTKEEGGTGIAEQFWDWSEQQIKAYA